jgi:hypothetical protein
VIDQQFDADLASRLAERFSERVIGAAELPAARAGDIRESFEVTISNDPQSLCCKCTITGSTYERPWDGVEATAFALTDEAAGETAYLVRRTPRYAWLRSRR